MADWNIRPRAMQCSACGKPFEPQMTGYSFLLTVGEQYERKDLCSDCFKVNHSPKDPLTSAGWSFTVPKESGKNNKKEVAVQKETAIQLLRKLITRAQPEDCDVIYILAILLERNKQFIERDVLHSNDGKTVRLYEFRPTGEFFSIVAPTIQPERLPDVQQRVIALLEGRETLATESPLKPAPKVKRYLRASFHHTSRVKRFRKPF